MPLNFFVLQNKIVETPEIYSDEYIKKMEDGLTNLYASILEEQIYLSNEGVPFSYTDTLDPYMRRDLIDSLIGYKEKQKSTNTLTQ